MGASDASAGMPGSASPAARCPTENRSPAQIMQTAQATSTQVHESAWHPVDT